MHTMRIPKDSAVCIKLETLQELQFAMHRVAYSHNGVKLQLFNRLHTHAFVWKKH